MRSSATATRSPTGQAAKPFPMQGQFENRARRAYMHFCTQGASVLFHALPSFIL
jgi:hypothetical protein